MYFRIKLTAFLSFLFFQAFAQQTVVTGNVKDAINKEPLSFVSVYFDGSAIGTLTDKEGNYKLSAKGNFNKIKFSSIGYSDLVKLITPAISQKIDVSLKESAKTLNEVTVSGKKRAPYKNKDNPAVALIRQVIDHKETNRIKAANTLYYKQDEKMSFSMSNISEEFKNRKVFKDFQFMFQEQDSNKIGGKNILPMFLGEKLSENYFKKSTDQSKTIILAEKQVDFSSKYVDNKGIKAYFDRMYQDIELYDNDIFLMSNQFLSPIANTAPNFYRFYITDTLKNQSPQLIELSFTPKNNTDMLFNGKLYITMDGKYAIKDASLSINKHINLNFVRALTIELDFDKDENTNYYLTKSNLIVDFGVRKENGMGFTGQRSVFYKDHKFNIPLSDSIFKGEKVEVLADAKTKDDSYWEKNRLDVLSVDQQKIYHNIDTLQNVPSFKRKMELATILFAGYKRLGPYELGPNGTFYSFNNVEGFRLRLGGRSTTKLSNTYYFENYAAYGFKDEKWKYFLSGTYAINHKSIYAFPQHYVKLSFQRDTKIPGSELQFIQENSLFFSFRRGVNDMLLYNDFYKVDYLKEYENHFSYALGFKKWTQIPAGGLIYNQVSSSGIKSIQSLTTSEFSIQLRYAPNETFYQGKTTRISFTDNYPVFNLRYSAGIKGLLGGEYSYNNFLGSVKKRFQLSQLGYADVTLEGGLVTGKVPFPLLTIHRANQSYANLFNSYNLMNFLEFVSDHYASVFIDQNFNGFILNKIPFIKLLKFREIVSFKALYGGLRKENNPAYTTNLYQFPLFDNGATRTYTIGKTPYIEAGIGIGNIFKVFRIDAIKRFNYLNNPEVTQWGVRATFKADF